MKKKTKIFLYNPYPAIGGVDTTIKRFLPSLKKKYAIEYISLDKKIINEGSIQNTVIKSKSAFKSFFKIYKIFKHDHCEKKIFFSFQYFANIWSIIFIKLLLKGKLIIYEVNHLDELNYSTNIKEFLKKKIIRFAVKYLYKYPDLVATNSKESTRDLAKFIKRKVYTLPNPCFKKITNIKRTLKPHKKINILNISRFENQKDHLTLLKAVNSSGIKDKINLILVGYGRNYHNIKRFIKENKINAKIFLKKTNLKKFYINSDLYICSSLYEGLPTTVVEAASYCLPIISSDFKSGIKEILKNGKTGTFFKKRDHKKLSKLILSYYLNPKPFLQKEYLCRKYLHKFSINESTSVLNKFLNKIS